jgi:hypothetical protein
VASPTRKAAAAPKEFLLAIFTLILQVEQACLGNGVLCAISLDHWSTARSLAESGERITQNTKRGSFGEAAPSRRVWPSSGEACDLVAPQLAL